MFHYQLTKKPLYKKCHQNYKNTTQNLLIIKFSWMCQVDQLEVHFESYLPYIAEVVVYENGYDLVEIYWIPWVSFCWRWVLFGWNLNKGKKRMADWSFVTAFFILFYVFSLEYELNHKMPEFLRLVASVYNRLGTSINTIFLIIN